MRKKIISPSILSADFSKLGNEINDVLAAGADWIHVDVMDGHFVPNLTIGAPVVKSLRKVTEAPLDVHLMIETPEKYIKDFAQAGADYLTIHVEATEHPATVLQEIRRLGMKPGITLRPRTAIAEVFEYLSLVDLVLVMTVEPGFGGQAFMLEQIDKVRALREEMQKQNVSPLIEVDGGVNAETIQYCADVDVIVAGSYVFGAKDRAQAITTLKGDRLGAS